MIGDLQVWQLFCRPIEVDKGVIFLANHYSGRRAFVTLWTIIKQTGLTPLDLTHQLQKFIPPAHFHPHTLLKKSKVQKSQRVELL